MSKEYIIVKDGTGTPVGKLKVNTKKALQNFAAWVVNETLVYGYAEYADMQDSVKDLPEISMDKEA